MTRNEELLTVTDENEEKLRSLVEKDKTYAPELFQRHYKITPEEFENALDIIFLLGYRLLQKLIHNYLCP